MQLTNLLLPVLALAGTINAGTFQIKDFSNGGAPHSAQTYIDFQVSDPSAKFTTTCRSSQPINGAFSVGTTKFPTKCDKLGVAFGLDYIKGTGYVLTVVHRFNKDQTINMGSIWLGNQIARRENPTNPNGNYDYLVYPESFGIAWNQYTDLKKKATKNRIRSA